MIMIHLSQSKGSKRGLELIFFHHWIASGVDLNQTHYIPTSNDYKMPLLDRIGSAVFPECLFAAFPTKLGIEPVSGITF